jgi:3-methyladenine DNA glycosylase AlkD
MNLTDRLFSLQDPEYRDFSAKLMPNVDKSTVIGVRTPQLRKLAREIYREGNYQTFLHNLPHKYYEENNLHGFLIEQIRDPKEYLQEIEKLLPYIDNWATCDLIHPKCLKKDPELVIKHVKKWLGSSHTYTVRYGIGVLLSDFLDELFRPDYLDWVAGVKSDEYYINMMRAWYFATALAKQYKAAIPFIENGLLDKWTHNRTLQKAVESYRIPDDVKSYLKQFRQS